MLSIVIFSVMFDRIHYFKTSSKQIQTHYLYSVGSFKII